MIVAMSRCTSRWRLEAELDDPVASTRMVPGEGVIQAGVALTKASGLSLARLVPGEGFIHTDRFMVTWHAVAQLAGGMNQKA